MVLLPEPNPCRTNIGSTYGYKANAQPRVLVGRDASDEEVQNIALDGVKSYVQNGYKKIIYVKGRIFNVIV